MVKAIFRHFEVPFRAKDRKTDLIPEVVNGGYPRMQLMKRVDCLFYQTKEPRTIFFRLEILQKQVIRTIAKTTFDAHTDPIFQNLGILKFHDIYLICLLYTSPSPRDRQKSRMPSSA